MKSFNEAPHPWQTLKDFSPFPLQEIRAKGSPSEPYPTWYRWRRKQGVYMLQEPGTGKAAYIGMTRDGTTEEGLSDRLWGLDTKRGAVGLRLEKICVCVRNCLVYVIEIPDAEERKKAKEDGIEYFHPIGNY